MKAGPVRTRRAPRGFNLPELLVALAIGLWLLAAFITVVVQCRGQFAAAESLARLQDTARAALVGLTDDIEHAGFQGFSNAAAPRLVRGGTTLAEAESLRQGDAATPVAGLPAGAHDCGVNFAVDLARAIEGADGRFAVGRDARDCAPTATAGGARAGSDTLTVRHASLEPAAPRAGRLQVYARRLAAHATLDLFADGHAPGPVTDDAVVRDLEVHTWYVANDSVDRPGWPALRVKSLTESRGAAQFRDEEVAPGVEDLQLELAVADPDDATRLRYVAPGSPAARDARVLGVRLWLRIRSDETEGGFMDSRPLSYAGITFTPDADEARQRRALFARTIALRNVSSIGGGL
jgi:prepilin-type N-terminal cleavage/methylation domain-containing protein